MFSLLPICLFKALCWIVLANICFLGLIIVIATCFYIYKKVVVYKRNRRKQKYKKMYKPTIAIDYFDDLFPPVKGIENPQHKRHKKKQLAKRRKRNKIARKSRKQNRK